MLDSVNFGLPLLDLAYEFIQPFPCLLHLGEISLCLRTFRSVQLDGDVVKTRNRVEFRLAVGAKGLQVGLLWQIRLDLGVGLVADGLTDLPRAGDLLFSRDDGLPLLRRGG